MRADRCLVLVVATDDTERNVRKVMGNLHQGGRSGKGHCRDVRGKDSSYGTRVGLLQGEAEEIPVSLEKECQKGGA